MNKCLKVLEGVRFLLKLIFACMDQLFVFDTVKKVLTSKDGEKAKIPFPISTVAGATAGVCSTLVMYPLELLKTRLTIQVSVFLLPVALFLGQT